LHFFLTFILFGKTRFKKLKEMIVRKWIITEAETNNPNVQSSILK